MSSSSRLRRRAAVVLAAVVFAVPSVAALGAVLDPDVPMVASARVGAERSSSVLQVGAVPPSNAEALAAEVVRLANLARAAAGRSTLAAHPAAGAAAVAHSLDQAAMGRMSHTGSDGSDGGDRLTRAGFSWWTWGENVAAGQRSAQDVVDAWMGSPGHRANILYGSFTTIGVGVATGADGTRYWTMIFAA